MKRVIFHDIVTTERYTRVYCCRNSIQLKYLKILSLRWSKITLALLFMQCFFLILSLLTVWNVCEIGMLSAHHRHCRHWLCLESYTQNTEERKSIIAFLKQSITLKKHKILMGHGMSFCFLVSVVLCLLIQQMFVSTLTLFRFGCWGICYTYGTWFSVKGLTECGKNYRNSDALRKACDFLLSKQLPNGGWGESYLSSQNKVWKSQLLWTAY